MSRKPNTLVTAEDVPATAGAAAPAQAAASAASQSSPRAAGVLRVRAVGVASRWRAGRQFTAEPIDVQGLSAAQRAAIEADPYLEAAPIES